ncbi:AraC family transcriptional regulator [Paenibacillus wynnii]|uniref:AraC family transcriptional regulator n=1 Tax=Paenibacillus wynnii TaxID=268407 RepID=UPI002793169E|nr:AraC family transcriptional regulator [Paenibacillus wynnii]MDQ0193808.1 AraC-like DNA-binding protein [Paenibacillus wynnii]
MSKVLSGKENRYYGKFFSVMTVIVFLTISILSSILYLNFERIALNQSYDQTMDSLAQTTQEASVMAVTAATFAKQIHNDQNIANLLNFSNVSAVDVSTAIKQLTNYRETSPFIDSIYVYNSEASTFYVSTDMSVPAVFSESEFYDLDMKKMLRHIEDYETLMPIPRKLRIEGLAGNIAEKKRDTYTFLLYDTLAKSPRRNAIIVNIKETQLHKHIDGSLTNDPANTFLIDKNGRLVSNSWTTPMLTDMRGTSYIDRILQNGQSSGYFASSVDGIKSLVTYSEPDYLGWRYIRIVPYAVISERIDSMRFKTFWIAAAILLAGLALSYLGSRKLFSSLNHKLSRLVNLESEQRESLQVMRSEYLRGLLNGYTNTDSERAKVMFERFGIKLDPSQPCRVLLITMDDYRSLMDQYTIDDRKLLRYGILNIAQELLTRVGRSAATADLGEDRGAIIIQAADSGEDEGEAYRHYSDLLQGAVTEYLKLSITISSSMNGLGIQSVHSLYQQAVEASFSRVFSGPGSYIDAETVEQNKAKSYEYPLNKEKQLVDELMLGRMVEVKRLFNEIIGATVNFSYISYQLAVSHLTFAVQNAIRTIRQHSPSSEELTIPSHQLYTHTQVETLEEVTKRYMDLFDLLEKYMDEKKKNRQDDLPGRIRRFIDEQYADQNLSLEMLADEMGMSATYIGRVFKQHTFQTILGYIQEVRMTKVRELLIETDDSIGDIAEQTGFANNPYFYKAFKKHNGVTPAEYRKSGRGQLNDGNADDAILA